MGRGAWSEALAGTNHASYVIIVGAWSIAHPDPARRQHLVRVPPTRERRQTR